MDLFKIWPRFLCLLKLLLLKELSKYSILGNVCPLKGKYTLSMVQGPKLDFLSYSCGCMCFFSLTNLFWVCLGKGTSTRRVRQGPRTTRGTQVSDSIGVTHSVDDPRWTIITWELFGLRHKYSQTMIRHYFGQDISPKHSIMAYFIYFSFYFIEFSSCLGCISRS